MAQAFKMSINKVFLYKILLLKQFVKQSKKAARLYQAKTLKAKTLKIIKFKRHYSKTLLKSEIAYYLNLLPNIPPTLSLSRPRRSENERKMKVKLLETNVYPRFCSDIQSRYASILSLVVAVL